MSSAQNNLAICPHWATRVYENEQHPVCRILWQYAPTESQRIAKQIIFNVQYEMAIRHWQVTKDNLPRMCGVNQWKKMTLTNRGLWCIRVLGRVAPMKAFVFGYAEEEGFSQTPVEIKSSRLILFWWTLLSFLSKHRLLLIYHFCRRHHLNFSFEPLTYNHL